MDNERVITLVGWSHLFVFFLHNFIQHFKFDNVWIMESDLKTLKRGYRVCLIAILKSVFRVSYTWKESLPNTHVELSKSCSWFFLLL